MDGFQLLACRLLVGQDKVVLFVETDVPYLSEETMTTVDAVCIPRLRLLQRTEEHFVKTQGVGTEILDNGIGIDNIVHRFAHLLHSPTADVFAIFENKFCIVILGTPCTESLNVELVILDNVNIDVKRCDVVLF